MDGPPTAHAPHLLLSSCPPAHSVGLPPRPPLLSLWAITLWFFLEPTWLAATYYSRFQSTVTTLWYHILSLCLYRVSLHLGTYELPCDDLFTRLCPRIRDSQDGDQIPYVCISRAKHSEHLTESFSFSSRGHLGEGVSSRRRGIIPRHC